MIAQQDRDKNVATLVETMQSTYLIVVGAENLADERLQSVLERVLKQTVICAFFVQEYARRGSFGGVWHERMHNDPTHRQ